MYDAFAYMYQNIQLNVGKKKDTWMIMDGMGFNQHFFKHRPVDNTPVTNIEGQSIIFKDLFHGLQNAIVEAVPARLYISSQSGPKSKG